MSEHKRFSLRSVDALREELSTLGLSLPIENDLGILGTPVALGKLTVRNRFAVHPMEGFDAAADGAPGELAFRRYSRYAAGGSALIWFEATAVLEEARSNPGQFWFHAGNLDTYKRLVDATRQAATPHGNVVLVIQLTHSGRYSKPHGIPHPLIAHRSPVLDPLHNLGADYPVVTDDYLDRLQDTYVGAAKLAAQAGFDGIDIKACHRYLVSELLASHTREGKYGGSFENRTRLLCETLKRIKAEVPGVFLTTRLNVFDAIRHPYGFGVDQNDERKPDLREPLELIRKLREIGLALLNISIGNPYFNPHYGRPFDTPIKGVPPPPEHPLEGVVRFLGITRQIQEANRDLPVIGSGYTWLRHLMPHVAAGVLKSGGATLIGQGRGAFAYPESVGDILREGRMDPAKSCVTCSGCTQIMRDGARTGCVVRDAEIYGPEYRRGRRFSPDRLRLEAQRCRQCLAPTCSAGCPANVDVPAFLKAFAANDIATSYGILRQRNVLPEMCAHVCPSDVQCEGGCLEKIFCENPIAVRDVQLVVCQIARRQGIVGVKLPAKTSGKRVAVVGGGPAGLACAIKLLEKGHAVTLFEKREKLGGTPDSTIPDARYRDASAEVDAILKPALDAKRLTLRLGCGLGADQPLKKLQSEFDAVFLGLGLGCSVSLGQAEGVVDALRFLQQAKRGDLKTIPPKVAVLGAGNTAMDAALTALRLGARDVFVVYRRSFAEMPAWPAERAAAVRAGVHFLILTQPLGYAESAGKLTGVRIARTELGEPDDSGRRRPITLPKTESVLEVGLTIEAMGQALPEELKAALAPLQFTRAGLLKVEAQSSFTGTARVFAGGDLVNGGTTAVQGVVEGMRAADEIDKALNA